MLPFISSRLAIERSHIGGPTRVSMKLAGHLPGSGLGCYGAGTGGLGRGTGSVGAFGSGFGSGFGFGSCGTGFDGGGGFGRDGFTHLTRPEQSQLPALIMQSRSSEVSHISSGLQRLTPLG